MKGKTIKDVAQLAGVSIATVSRYINHNREFSKEVSDKIDDAIKILNYTPNFNAVALKSNISKSIGIIVPDMIVFSYVFEAIEELLFDKGYSLIIGCSRYSDEVERSLLLNFYNGNKVCGIFLASNGNNLDILDMMNKNKFPLILFDRYIKQNPLCNYVLENGVDSINLLTRKLITMGHKNIAYLKGPDTLDLSIDRYNEFLKILEEYSIKPIKEYHFSHVLDKDDIIKASNIILNNTDKVTAVITTNAKQIKYFMMTAHIRKKRVPEDISITGFGIAEFSDLFEVPITCILHKPKELAVTCVDLMMQLLKNKDTKPNLIVIENELVIGQSIKDLNCK